MISFIPYKKKTKSAAFHQHFVLAFSDFMTASFHPCLFQTGRK